MAIKRSRTAAFYGLALLLAGLPACSFWNAGKTVDRDREIEAFAEEGGYSTSDLGESSTHETWLHDEIPIAVTIQIPEESGKLPVVVYLPGVGEDADHGELWKRAWTRAGYVVVTVQPRAFGDGFWTREQVNAGDFATRARAAFSPAQLAGRLAHLAWTLEKLKSRVTSGNERYSNIDLERMALAGYDLGAQEVMAIAGEKTGVEPPKSLPAFKSAIVVSPSVDPSSQRLEQRFGQIRMPLLVITSERDRDPSGISTPASRQSLWRGLAGDDNYLLVLREANHRLLSGTMSNSLYWSEVTDPIIHERRRAPARRAGDYDGSTGATSSSGKGRLNAGIASMPAVPGALRYGATAAAPSGGDEPGGRSANSPAGGGPGGPRGKEPREEALGEEIAVETMAARQMAIVESVTAAFLDATVLESGDAREWLEEKALPWLKDYAHWLVKSAPNDMP